MKWYYRLGKGFLVYVLAGFCAIVSMGGSLQDLSGTKILLLVAWPPFLGLGAALEGGPHPGLSRAYLAGLLASFFLGCFWISSFVFPNSRPVKWAVQLALLALFLSFVWIYLARIQNVVFN